MSTDYVALNILCKLHFFCHQGTKTQPINKEQCIILKKKHASFKIKSYEPKKNSRAIY